MRSIHCPFLPQTLQKWQLVFFFFCLCIFWVQNFPQLHMQAIFLVPRSFLVSCCWRRGVSRGVSSHVPRFQVPAPSLSQKVEYFTCGINISFHLDPTGQNTQGRGSKQSSSETPYPPEKRKASNLSISCWGWESVIYSGAPAG